MAAVEHDGQHVEALEAALHGDARIFNTDQGSQFASAAFTDRVQAAGARCWTAAVGAWRLHRAALAVAEV